jgi:hypothetical protein
MTSIDDISNSVKANEDFLENISDKKVDPKELLVINFLNNYKNLATSKGYHLSGSFINNSLHIDVTDTKVLRLSGYNSFRKFRDLLPTEYNVSEADEVKTYAVEVYRIISSRFLKE